MSEKDSSSQQRTQQQNKSIHLGCQQIANHLVENGVSLQEAFSSLEIRPTMESIKGIFRQIAHAKYGVDSTKDLEKKQVDEVWEDLSKALSESTGVYFGFPSMDSEALEHLEYEA